MLKPIEDWFYWHVPAAAKRRSDKHPPIRLPRMADNGRNPERAAQSRELTRDMIRTTGDAPVERAAMAGIRRSLIAGYTSESDSPFQGAEAYTRDSNHFMLAGFSRYGSHHRHGSCGPQKPEHDEAKRHARILYQEDVHDVAHRGRRKQASLKRSG